MRCQVYTLSGHQCCNTARYPLRHPVTCGIKSHRLVGRTRRGSYSGIDALSMQEKVDYNQHVGRLKQYQEIYGTASQTCKRKFGRDRDADAACFSSTVCNPTYDAIRVRDLNETSQLAQKAGHPATQRSAEAIGRTIQSVCISGGGGSKTSFDSLPLPSTEKPVSQRVGIPGTVATSRVGIPNRRGVAGLMESGPVAA